jgi:Dolichyl-phosphate-mannose-protein mannosyltransferase
MAADATFMKNGPLSRGNPVAVSITLAVFYCAGMALAWRSSTQMPVDWAYELVVNTRFQLAYYQSNPPLYSWIVHVLLLLMRPGVAIFLLINYSCLFVSLLLVLAIASKVLESSTLIALAPWSLFLDFYFSRLNFGFEQTELVIVFYLLTVLLLMRIALVPRPADFVLLGLTAGCGFISKYDYIFGLAILLAAFCLRPSLRKSISSPWIAASAAIAMLIVAPIIWGFYAHHWDLLTLLNKKTRIGETIRAGGLSETVANLFVYTGPSILLACLVIWLGRDANRQNLDHDRDDKRRDLSSFLRDAQWIALGIILAGVVAFAVRRIGSWYLHAFFLLLPLVCLGVADRRRSAEKLIPLCAASIFAMVLLGTANRLLALTPLCKGDCRDVVPYDRLAVELRRAGFGHGAILSPDVMVSGNLKPYFPDSAVGVITGLAPNARAPDDPVGQCLLIWQDRNPASLPSTQLSALDVRSPAVEVRTVEIPFRFQPINSPFGTFGRRSAVWHYLLADQGSKKCG